MSLWRLAELVLSVWCVLCARWVRGSERGVGGSPYWEVFNAPKGPRPEKVKYPGMGEPSIVKWMYNYSFKLYIGPYTMYCRVLIYICAYINLSIMQT